MCILPRDSSTTMVLVDEIVQELQQVIDREAACVRGDCLKDLSPEEFSRYTDIRCACLHYIRSSHMTFHTQPDTFAVAVTLLDLVLWKFKVTQRFMSIIGVACYVIAAKVVEEEERIPRPVELAQLPGNEWTPRDLCRMELYILEKLSWSPPRVSYLSYLPVFAKLFHLNQNLLLSTSSLYLAEKCLRRTSTVLMPPSVLALALVLRLTGSPDDEIQHEKKIADLIRFCKIDEGTLKRCSAQISSFSPPLSFKATSVLGIFPKKIFFKPSDVGTPDLETIEE